MQIWLLRMCSIKLEVEGTNGKGRKELDVCYSIYTPIWRWRTWKKLYIEFIFSLLHSPPLLLWFSSTRAREPLDQMQSASLSLPLPFLSFNERYLSSTEAQPKQVQRESFLKRRGEERRSTKKYLLRRSFKET